MTTPASTGRLAITTCTLTSIRQTHLNGKLLVRSIRPSMASPPLLTKLKLEHGLMIRDGATRTRETSTLVLGAMVTISLRALMVLVVPVTSGITSTTSPRSRDSMVRLTSRPRDRTTRMPPSSTGQPSATATGRLCTTVSFGSIPLDVSMVAKSAMLTLFQ